MIRRRGRERVALVAADELAGLLETAPLLRSPRNAARLLAALRHALKGSGRGQSLAALRRDVGRAPLLARFCFRLACMGFDVEANAATWGMAPTFGAIITESALLRVWQVWARQALSMRRAVA